MRALTSMVSGLQLLRSAVLFLRRRFSKSVSRRSEDCMSVIPFDAYRAHGVLEVRLEEVRRFVHMNRSGDTALAYHIERLEKAVDGLKKALFEFQGTVLL